MASTRHTRLSSSSLNAKPPQRKRSSLRKKAKTVASSLAESRQVAKQNRANALLEKREINRFLKMAEKHVPDLSEIEAMTDIEQVANLIKVAYAALLRASCTSRREIEDIVASVMRALKDGDVFDDDIALEETQERVGDFLLGKCDGVSMVDTLVPAQFNQTKPLKKVFNRIWPSDSAYSAFTKLVVDKKRFWKFVLGVRQKMTEKLNKGIYTLFVCDPISKKSIYDKALGKCGTSLLAKYSITENYETLPVPYILEREYAMSVVVETGLDRIIENWAGSYYLDMPHGNHDAAYVGILNARAVSKGAASVHLNFHNIFEKLKKIRLEESNISSDLGSFPYSQRGIEIPSDDDNFSLLDKREDAHLNETQEDVAAPLKDSDLSTQSSEGKTELPVSQKRTWLASFEVDTEEDSDLIEVIPPKKAKKANTNA